MQLLLLCLCGFEFEILPITRVLFCNQPSTKAQKYSKDPCLSKPAFTCSKSITDIKDIFALVSLLLTFTDFKNCFSVFIVDLDYDWPRL